MAQSLKNSRTKENLMKAFAGESQARNRYTAIPLEQSLRAGRGYMQSKRYSYLQRSRNGHMQSVSMSC